MASRGYAREVNFWMTDHISLIKTKEVIFWSVGNRLINTHHHACCWNK